MIEVTEKRERSHKQLIDNLMEEREYCKLKKEVLDRTLCRTRLARAMDWS
jgi:hypothetical protein